LDQPISHSEVLPNGLTLLTCETRLAPVAEVQLWARVGSADERSHEAGLAHFHEHMLFKGTERRGVGAIAGAIEGAGGRINAYTSFDVTVYHATLPSDQTAVGIDVLSDAVLNSVFDPTEIQREIDVVLEEIRRSEDSPTQVLSQAVFTEFYRVHPYRAPILGSHESVASFDHDRVQAFFQRWYTPDNLVAVVAGDIHRDAVRDQLCAAFDGRTRGEVPRKRADEPRQSERRTVVCARPFERVNLELAFPGVRLRDADCAALDLLSFVLGNSESSRLFRHVKERDGHVDHIDAYSYTPMDPGMTSIGIATDSERALQGLEASIAEVERLRVEPVSNEELERARVNFLASEHFERESVSGLAQKLGTFHVSAGDYREESEYMARVRAATPDDLLRVAHRYLSPDQITVGAVLTEADAAGLDADRIGDAISRGVDRVSRAFSVPPRRPAERESQIHSYTLDGGAQLHVLPRRAVPVAALRAAFMGGMLSETNEDAGLTAYLTSMWLRGTQKHSAAEFARRVENMAAEIDGFSGRSSLGVTLETPVNALDATLELAAEMMLEPAFEAEELERERNDTLAAIERREDRIAQLAFLLFTKTHYETHPYGRPLLGSAESVAAFDAERVRKHHARLIRSANLSLAIAGDVDPDAIAVRVASCLSGLDTTPFEAPAPPMDAAPAEIRTAEIIKDRAQSHLVIGFRGLTVHDPDRFALETIAQLLAGQGGRLFLELRDRKGLAYSVSAANTEGLAPGYFTVYIATAPDKLDEAREGMLDELRRVVDAAPSAAELERAQRYLTGNFAIGQQRNAAHAAQISLNGLYGLGADADRDYAANVTSVSRDDVLRVAQRIIDLDAYTLAVVRP
jgi:zinc protease